MLGQRKRRRRTRSPTAQQTPRTPQSNADAGATGAQQRKRPGRRERPARHAAHPDLQRTVQNDADMQPVVEEAVVSPSSSSDSDPAASDSDPADSDSDSGPDPQENMPLLLPSTSELSQPAHQSLLADLSASRSKLPSLRSIASEDRFNPLLVGALLRSQPVSPTASAPLSPVREDGRDSPHYSSDSTSSDSAAPRRFQHTRGSSDSDSGSGSGSGASHSPVPSAAPALRIAGKKSHRKKSSLLSLT